jgi:exonuclease SbcC
MKINMVKIRGAIGIMKGQGVDEVSLDLSRLSGLVGFEGPNGKGKSTILENLHPFAVLPSRKGALQHHFGLRDSFRDLVFEFNGDEIRTLIKLDSQSAKSEGFVWVNGQPKVDGKISSYKAFIEELLGSQNLFFNSVFCAQNSGKISDMTTGELKALFSEFLRLDRYIQFENTAKQGANILTGKITDKDLSLSIIQSKIQAIPEHIQITILNKMAQKGELDAMLNKSITDISAKETELKAAQIKNQENDKLNVAHTSALKALSQLRLDSINQSKQSETELSAIRQKASDVIAKIKPLEDVLKDKVAIEAAAADVLSLTEEISKVQIELNSSTELLSQISTTINDLDRERREASHKLETLKGNAEVKQIEAEINTLRKQTSILELRNSDIACPDKNAQCMFVKEAFKAQARITELEAKLPAIKKVNEELQVDIQKQINLYDEKLKTFRDQQAQTEKIKTQHKTLLDFATKKLADRKPLAAKMDQIKIAEASLDALHSQKEQIIADGVKLKESWDIRLKDLKEREEKQNKEAMAIYATIDKKITDIIFSLEIELESLLKTKKDTEKAMQDINVEIDALFLKSNELEKLNLDLAAAQQEKIVINSRISNWLYLKNAFSKDGLRALEIDSVAPSITGYANSLLNETFGPMFSVRFRTQDDAGKECLDIIVIRDDGTEVLLDNLSGGEKVWNLKALRLAMTLISKEKSGKNYKSLFCDEEDGALSKDNAIQFINLYRSVMSLAGMDTCYYISHKPEALELADHRLIFGKGGIVIE